MNNKYTFGPQYPKVHKNGLTVLSKLQNQGKYDTLKATLFKEFLKQKAAIEKRMYKNWSNLVGNEQVYYRTFTVEIPKQATLNK